VQCRLSPEYKINSFLGDEVFSGRTELAFIFDDSLLGTSGDDENKHLDLV
jgi:hypothetical protein